MHEAERNCKFELIPRAEFALIADAGPAPIVVASSLTAAYATRVLAELAPDTGERAGRLP